MRSSPAEARPMALGRSPDPLDQVDYRLAQTPEQKDEIYRLRYRAYLREGAIQPSADGRVIDQFEDAPNAWTFGVYFHGELYSSIRLERADVGMADVALGLSYSAMSSTPNLTRAKVIIDPTRFVADPEKGANFPELPYVTLRLGYLACDHFNADIGLGDRACRAPGVLPPRVPA